MRKPKSMTRATYVFVKNLHPSINKSHLKSIFAKFGTIVNCKVSQDSKGKSNEFGFVEFQNERMALKACHHLHGTSIKGKKLWIEMSDNYLKGLNMKFLSFQFVQQWAKTFFLRNGLAQTVRYVDEFYIHGLWINPEEKTKPSNCKIRWSEVKYLEHDLKRYWPNLWGELHNKSFWLHEWSKSGYWTDITPSAFFRQALELRYSYNLSNILKKGGVLDLVHPTARQISDCIAKELGARPLIEAFEDTTPSPSKYYLSQIHLFFDATFQLIDYSKVVKEGYRHCNECDVLYF